MNYMPPMSQGTPQAPQGMPLPPLGPGMPPVVEVRPQVLLGPPAPPPPLITAAQAQAQWMRNYVGPEDGGLDYDEFNGDLMRQGSGLLGLGVTKKKAAKKPAAPVPDQKVTVTAPEPIKSSTMNLVVGGAVVAVIASVALWIWARRK